MNFLLPAFIGVAGLVALPLILHLLRLQPRAPVAFPTLRFLGRDALKDSRHQRIRRWITFFLRCLVILFAAAAFARPFWRLEHTENSRAIVVVVDNSYSMQAAGRIEAVQAWLKPQLSSLRPPDQLGVLVLHPTPEWIVPLGPDLDAGRLVLEKLPRACETTRYRSGLDLAATALAAVTTKQKQILLAADQQRLGWSEVRFDRPLPPGVELVAAPAAALPKRQAAITAFKATRAPLGRIAVEASLTGCGDEAEERTVTFYDGDARLGETKCRLRGKTPRIVAADFPVAAPDEAHGLRAELDTDDLPLDDIAYAVLPATGDRRVILAPASVRSPVDFLGLALRAAHGGKLPDFRVDPLPAPGAPWPVTSVALLRGSAPFLGESRRALDAFIAAGGSAWVIFDGSPAQTEWLAARGVVPAPLPPAAAPGLKLRDLALDHPLYAAFEGQSIAPLLAPTFRRGWALVGPSVVPLARWPDRSVAIAEVSTGMGRLLITGFDETRESSTFPLGAAYVPVIHQAVIWLADNNLLAPDVGHVGEPLPLSGEGVWRPLISPVMAAPARVNGCVIPAAPGLYEFEAAGLRRRYAINLDTTESDLAPWPTPADFALLNSKEPVPTTIAKIPADAPAAVVDEHLIDERGVWWWLIAAAVVLLVFEFALANRTIP